MKKTIWTIFILLITVASAFGQAKTTTILDKNIGKVHLKYSKIVDLETLDSVYMVWMGFQNARYSSITDIKSVDFRYQEDLSEFIKDLNSAKKQMDAGEKVDMSWDRQLYGLHLHEFTKELSLNEAKGRGYTWLRNKDVEKLILTLNRISVGSDQLLPETK